MINIGGKQKEEKKAREDSSPKLERTASKHKEEQKADTENKVIEVETLWKEDQSLEIPNPMVIHGGVAISNRFLPAECCIPKGAFTLRDRYYVNEEQLLNGKRYKKAGPKTHIYYDPNRVKAAIVTCGGLCPGENVVIREVVMMLWYGYGVRDIYGVKFGFKGFYETTEDGKSCFVNLLPDLPPNVFEIPKGRLPIKDIHNIGGTILGSSRGGFDAERIVDGIVKYGINQVYAIGGDGTHRGLLALSKYLKKKKIQVTLIGIPKTIDNDMPLLDKTFGFDSAVEVAMWAIQCADVEANCAEYGVGLVKVMGRAAGHIAMHASLANRDVNVCLIPEFPFDVYGPKGLMEYVIKRLRDRRHCVIVCAEGAAAGMRDVKLSEEVRKDPSGNIIPEDICDFLKKEVPKYGMKYHQLDITLKYIDPSYLLRSVPPNSSDKYLCA